MTNREPHTLHVLDYMLHLVERYTWLADHEEFMRDIQKHGCYCKHCVPEKPCPDLTYEEMDRINPYLMEIICS